jgi:hypothetical protein
MYRKKSLPPHPPLPRYLHCNLFRCSLARQLFLGSLDLIYSALPENNETDLCKINKMAE